MADGADLYFPWDTMAAVLESLGGRDARKLLKRAMAQTGDVYEAEAVALAPHLTGYLENSSTVRTRETPGGVQTEIAFTANYAATVHELPSEGSRGKKTLLKDRTKYGIPGPRYLSRVLKGMDFEYFIGEAVRGLLRTAAGRGR